MFRAKFSHDPCLEAYMRRWEVEWPDALEIFPFVGMVVNAKPHRYGTPWAVVKQVDRDRMSVVLGAPENWQAHKSEYIEMHGD